MIKESPNVIFKSKYLLALNSIDNKFHNKDKRLKDVDEMLDYFSNEKKKVVGMFEYYMGHTRGDNINLVMEDGSYATKEDLKIIKNNYKRYIENSNLWKGIISFNPEYLNKNIDIKTLEQKMAKEVMPQFLNYCGFDNINNMSYVFSIHNNTKHPHIHFSFIEKKPNYKYSNNKIGYRRRGKITIDEQRYLKRLVELVIEREKYYKPLLIKTNEDIDYLKTYFKPDEKNFILNNINEIFIEEDILKLGELLNQYRRQNNQVSKKIKYNSIKNNELGKEIKSLTNNIKKYLFNDDTSVLYNCRKDIDEDLDKLNNYFNLLNENNNINEIVSNNGIVNKKGDYIDNYIYNAIVNHALFKYNNLSVIVKNKTNKDIITIDDLIQEIASRNKNKYSDKKRRKRILDNYFKNDSIYRFPSKYKMEKALKNINYEMEKAKEEFSKLFNYDDKNLK